MKKKFKLSFGDGQELPFFEVDVNEDGTAVDSSQQNKLFALENSARIIDISHLEYIPVTESVYDLQANDFPESDKSRPNPEESGIRAFAYLVNNVLYGKLYIRPGTVYMDNLIEALEQDPAIIPFD